jgi:Major Facilitator Superfamily
VLARGHALAPLDRRVTAAQVSTRAQWILLTLLVVSIFINYIDRSNLSIAAPVIERELSLSPVQIGALFSAFFWTYALVQLFGIAGWLADRFPAGLVLGAGFFLWSGATIATGLVSGLAALFFARLALGAGESVAYPCYSRILASEVPQHRRGLANALIDAGSKLGPALGSFYGRDVGGDHRLARFLHRRGCGEPAVADSLVALDAGPRSFEIRIQPAGGRRCGRYSVRALRGALSWGIFAGTISGSFC